MVKAYLKYELDSAFGLSCTNYCKNYINNKTNALITGNGEILSYININTGTVINQLRLDSKSKISIIRLSENNEQIITAVGMADGNIFLIKNNIESDIICFDNHNTIITDMLFTNNNRFLVSSSNDGKISVIDIMDETLKYKLSGHSGEINFINIINDKYIISGSSDGTYRYWDIIGGYCVGVFSTKLNCPTTLEQISAGNSATNNNIYIGGFESENIVIYKQKELTDNNQLILLKEKYKYKREYYSKIKQIKNIKKYLFILNDNNMIEVYKISDSKTLKNKTKRKLNRLKQKGNNESEDNHKVTKYASYLQFLATLRLKDKVNDIQILCNKLNYEILIVVFYSKNYFEYYCFNAESLKFEFVSIFSKLSHQFEVKNLVLSNDDSLLISSDKSAAKLWSTYNNSFLKVIDIKDITACRFLPRDRFIIFGSYSGALILYDNQINNTISTIPDAHKKAITSVEVIIKNNIEIEIVTASLDYNIKYWNIVKNNNTIGLSMFKKIELQSEITKMKFSSNNNFMLVSNHTNNLEIYYADTAKLYSTLIGHKFPVSCFDISTDNEIIVSGGADKSIKIWDFKFGNCKKSIFAHDAAVSDLKLLKDTHYILSISKDNYIKFWDADTYEQVMEFNINNEMLKQICVSSIGDFFICAFNDKLLRKFKQLKDIVYAAEFLDNKKNQEYLIHDLKKKSEADSKSEERKLKNLRFGDEIMEAIDTAEKYKNDYLDFEFNLDNYLKGETDKEPELKTYMELNDMSIPEYVFDIITGIKPNELERSIKFLHFAYVEKIIYYIHYFVIRNIHIETCVRLINIFCKRYFVNISANDELLRILIIVKEKLKHILKYNLNNARYNLNVIKLYQRHNN